MEERKEKEATLFELCQYGGQTHGRQAMSRNGRLGNGELMQVQGTGESVFRPSERTREEREKSAVFPEVPRVI